MGDQASRDSGDRTASILKIAIGFGIIGGLLWAGSGVWFVIRFVWRDAPVGDIVPSVFVRAIGLLCLFMLAGLWAVNRVAATRSGRGGHYGVAACAVGFLLVLPATVIPSGTLSPSFSRLIPAVFFTGITALAIGAGLLGTSTVRHDVLPAAIGIPFDVALPGGFLLGFFIAMITGKPLAVPVGLTVPFGLAWTALCGYVWGTDGRGDDPDAEVYPSSRSLKRDRW